MVKPDLTTFLGKIKLENPLVLASGILGNTADLLVRVARAGAGAVTTKSIGPRENMGHPSPNIVEVNCGYINAMGLPNPGIQKFVEEVKKYKLTCSKPLIGSIYGSTEKEYALVAEKMSEAGADIIELNVSCPHSKEGIINIGWDAKLVSRVVKSVKDVVNKPVFLKLPGNTNIKSLKEVVNSAIKYGIDGFTAINTLPAMAIDVETMLPILGNTVGGLSGPAIKPIGVRIVYELRKITDLPIIGVGGVKTHIDVLEYVLAGANAVAIGSALVHDKEITIFKEIQKNLEEYLAKKNIKTIRELIGLIHRK